MDKKNIQFSCTETDNGFRIEVTGISLRDAFSCCCMPMFGAAQMKKVVCCPPGEDDKSECCPPETKKG